MLINEKTGALVEFGKYADLFEAAKTLSVNQAKYDKNLRDLYKDKYSATKMYRETKKVYKDLC